MGILNSTIKSVNFILAKSLDLGNSFFVGKGNVVSKGSYKEIDFCNFIGK